MAEVSAGVLGWRRRGGAAEFLLVHPGGPFWKKRDEGAWSIPKGRIDVDEDPLTAAVREFREETGLPVDGAFTELAPLRQKGGKLVRCWMVAADLDLAGFASNTFELELPRGSGRRVAFPECDRAEYFATPAALRKILPGQSGFIAEAAARLG